MDIYRMKKEACDRMLDGGSMKFVIIGETGQQNAEWLDPYFGLLIFEGHKGFTHVNDIAEMPISVE